MAPPKSRKIAVMGFRSVGKSSLTIQYVEGQFVDSYDPTIENTFTKSVKYKGQEFVLELIDTAGQDEYSIFPQSYSMGIHGYVIVYTVTSAKSHPKGLEMNTYHVSSSMVIIFKEYKTASFEVAKVIHEKLLDMTGQNYVPMVLVGNKTDLHMERVVSTESGKVVADSWKAAFFEASAKENSCVQEIFNSMLYEIEKHQNGPVEKKEDCNIL